MKRLRSKLTYANVMATIAVFIALGGAAYAAGLPKNSVGSKQIKKNAVSGAKIKKGAVTGAKIKLASLGTVPRAADAQTLQSLTPSAISASSKLRCPGDTTLVAGVCFESSTRDEIQMETAILRCAEDGRFLPSVPMLWTYQTATFHEQPPLEWAGQPIQGDAESLGLVSARFDHGGNFGYTPITGTRPYRCAVMPSN